MGLALVRAPEDKTPIGEAHSRPPDLPDPQTQGSTVREPESDHPKACACAHQTWRPVSGTFTDSAHFWACVWAPEGGGGASPSPRCLRTRMGGRLGGGGAGASPQGESPRRRTRWRG